MRSAKRSRKQRIGAREHLKSSAGDPSQWDWIDWRSWTVTGRVLPERCDVRLGPAATALVTTTSRAMLRIHVVNSHITMKCFVDVTDLTVFQLSDMAKNALAGMLDYISFMNRGYYDIILDTCIDDATGETAAIPIFEPIFEPLRTGALFSPSERFSGNMPMAAVSSDAFATALHDLSQAARYTPRTMEYCRMALEAVRSHFDPDDEQLSWRERYRQGEKSMCAILKLSRDRLKRLDAEAAPGRHGERPYGMDWAARKSSLEFAWEAVQRFQFYLEGQPSDNWEDFA